MVELDKEMTAISDISTKSAQHNAIMIKEIEEWKIKQANYLDYKTQMDKESSQHLRDLDFALNQKMESSSYQIEGAIAKVKHFIQSSLSFDDTVITFINGIIDVIEVINVVSNTLTSSLLNLLSLSTPFKYLSLNLQ